MASSRPCHRATYFLGNTVKAQNFKKCVGGDTRRVDGTAARQEGGGEQSTGAVARPNAEGRATPTKVPRHGT